MTVSKTVVLGSSPSGRATLRVGLEVVPARSHKPNDVGSSPTPATKNFEKSLIKVFSGQVSVVY
jgi:hypothetical protein